MKAIEQNQRQKAIVKEISFETMMTMNCFQIRGKLDAVFDGSSPLEQTPADLKRILFGHLETCASCCRSFDVRIHFRPSGHIRFY